MSEDPLPEVTEQFARSLSPDPDEVIAEMDGKADREGFPTVGPAVGGWLRLLARLVDADELDEAREFLDRGGYADRAVFEHGDAIEIVGEYDGPFDVVLIDNEKHRYTEAFEAVRDRVPVGGVVAADNAIEAGPLDFGDVRALLAGEDVDTNEPSRGIADYLERVRDDPDFETGLLPLGEGVAVSVRVG